MQGPGLPVDDDGAVYDHNGTAYGRPDHRHHDARDWDNNRTLPLFNPVVFAHYNYTGKAFMYLDRHVLRADAKVYIAIAVLIILANLLIVAAIVWAKKYQRNTVFYIIGNLALADAAAGVGYIMNFATSGHKTLLFTPLGLLLRDTWVIVPLTASLLTLFMLAVERADIILYRRARRASKQGRRRCVLYGLLAVWVGSWLLALCPLVGWNCLGRLPRCSNILPLYDTTFVVFILAVYVTIMLLIGVLYTYLYFYLLRQRGQHTQLTMKRYNKLFFTVSAIIATFFVFWIPLFALFLADAECTLATCPWIFKFEFVVGFSSLNALINPILYVVTHPELGKTIHNMLFCLGRPLLGETSRTSSAAATGGPTAPTSPFGSPVLLRSVAHRVPTPGLVRASEARAAVRGARHPGHHQPPRPIVVRHELRRGAVTWQ